MIAGKWIYGRGVTQHNNGKNKIIFAYLMVRAKGV
jgi:hypothetical protein